MTQKIPHTLLFLFLLTSSLFAWGAEGHKLITDKALTGLPAEMRPFAPWFKFIYEHCTDPDTRKDAVKGEGVRHYVDADFYKEFRAGKMVWIRDTLEARYGKEKVEKMGVLPWAIEETYAKLVSALRTKNAADAKQMMADLAHYVADAHQPMHTMLNYDGQLSGQKGIHARYESDMIEKHFAELEPKVKEKKPAQRKKVFPFITGFITETHFLHPVLYQADLYATKEAGAASGDEYLRILWFYTRSTTVRLFNEAVKNLGDLYYSAFLEAGSPAFSSFNNE